jgi:hypothetical protein
MSWKDCQGQSLWEVIIALSIVGLIALGLVRATGSSVKSTRFSGNQSIMTALAQEKISQIVNQKNKNYKTFWDGNYFPDDFIQRDIVPEEDYCLRTRVASAGDWPAGYTPKPDDKMVKITVDVFWESKGPDPKCEEDDFNHKLKFETTLTNK